MRRTLRAIVLIGVAGLTLVNAGCATLDWLMDVEQRKNQWLRETFFGTRPPTQMVSGNSYNFDNPNCCPNPGTPPTVRLQAPTGCPDCPR
jgi:hypothetical protein